MRRIEPARLEWLVGPGSEGNAVLREAFTRLAKDGSGVADPRLHRAARQAESNEQPARIKRATAIELCHACHRNDPQELARAEREEKKAAEQFKDRRKQRDQQQAEIAAEVQALLDEG